MFYNFIEFKTSETHQTLPSFFWMINVGDAHSDAPHISKMLMSQRRNKSSLSTSR